MTAAPPRANLAGSPTNAVAKAALAQQYDYMTERLEGIQVNVASAATVDIGSQASSSINITGTTTITSFGTVYSGIKALRFAGVLTLTHNATTLILPTAANITTQAGDQCFVAPNANPATGWRVLGYERADGSPLSGNSAARSPIAPVTASVAASALTISCGAITLDFRNATLGNGAVTTVSGTPANLVVSSGSTLGTVNATLSRLAVLALNNAGTIELAVVNLAGGVDLSENGVISTTAEGGAGAADSANVVYSTTARTNVPYRILRFIESTQATAGAWATAPSLVAGSAEPLALWFGGYGQSWQTIAGAALNTSYTNTSGRRRDITIIVLLTAGNAAVLNINGVDRFLSQNNGSGGVNFSFSASLNPGDVYRVNNSSGGTLNTWSENR